MDEYLDRADSFEFENAEDEYWSEVEFGEWERANENFAYEQFIMPKFFYELDLSLSAIQRSFP